jgi:hypothetical protein
LTFCLNVPRLDFLCVFLLGLGSLLAQTKGQTLWELVDFFSSRALSLRSGSLGALFQMIAVNIFRPLPPASAEVGVEDDKPVRQLQPISFHD